MARPGRLARRRAARPDAARAPRRATAGSRCSGSSRPTRAGSPESIEPLEQSAPTGCARSARSPPRCARSRRPGSTGWCRCGARRGVDAAAGQLIVREAGGLVSFPSCDQPLGAPLTAEPSSPVVAARSPETLAELERIPRVIDWIIAQRIADVRGRQRRRASSRPPTWPRWPASPRRAWSPTPGWSRRRPLPPPEGIEPPRMGRRATSTRCGSCSTRCSQRADREPRPLKPAVEIGHRGSC